MLSKLRQNFSTASAKAVREFKHLVIDTPIEILFFAVTGAAIVGTMSYDTNKAREAEIPIAFSEIERITARFEGQGQAVPALTQFYAMNNDISMKVFEASNEALRQGEDPALFARALRDRVTGGDSEHALISTYTARMPADAAAAMTVLAPVSTAARDLTAVTQALENTWTDRHQDHYRTEIYYETVCSGTDQNRSCSQQMRTRQVYDYTIHTYTYHPAEGRRALQLLEAYQQNHGDIRINERLHTATEVGAANLAVITRSMKDMLDGELPSPAQALEYANTWARGATFNVNINDVYAQHRRVLTGHSAWQGAIGSARSDRYRTYSRSDSGPQAFQVVEQALDATQNMRREAASITGGVTFSAEAAPRLERQIDTFIQVALYGREGNAHELRRDVLALARDIYNKNHANGFDVEPFSWPEVLLFTFLGLLGGAALGAGVDRIIAMPSIRDMLTREKPKKQPRPKTPQLGQDAAGPMGDLAAEWRRREEAAARQEKEKAAKDRPPVDLDGRRPTRWARRRMDV